MYEINIKSQGNRAGGVRALEYVYSEMKSRPGGHLRDMRKGERRRRDGVVLKM